MRTTLNTRAPLALLQGGMPANGGNAGAGGNRRGGGGVSRGGQKSANDLQPLPLGEAGAEIVKAANPWTRAGPSDEHERLLRLVKGCVAAQAPLEIGVPTAPIRPHIDRLLRRTTQYFE